MPGPATHLTIMELQMARAKANPGSYQRLNAAFASNASYANLGSIGPDMLFWADWGGYSDIVNTIFDCYRTFDEIYETLAALWKPVGDAIDKVETVITGGLNHALSDTFDIVSAIIKTKLLDLITSELDYWQTLKPHQQINAPNSSEKDWNWLDYTHHRRTGVLCKDLIDRAHGTGKDHLRAYSYGWLSHVTADVAGHPYVNQAAGGPWRTHFLRHHLQENFMDVWAYGFYHTPGVSMPNSVASGVDPFDYEKFTNVGSANLHKLIDVGDDMPMDLQNLIADSLKQVYSTVPHPTVIPFLGPSEINRAYQMLMTAFEFMSGKDHFLGKPKPPEVFGDMEPPSFPTPGGSGSGSGGSGGSSGGFSLADLLKAIFESIVGALAYVGDLILYILSLGTAALTYPIRYAIYLIQLGLYEVYRNFRWALVISGYMYPDPDQLARPEARQFICPSDSLSRIYSQTPRVEWSKERDHAQDYPAGVGTENPNMLISPYRFGDLNFPHAFIEAEKYSPDIEKGLSAAATPEQTRGVGQRLAESNGHGGGSLGSALDFYFRRADEVEADGGKSGRLLLPDWNLDGDRGYGSKCWKPNSKLENPQPNTSSLTVSVEYLP